MLSPNTFHKMNEETIFPRRFEYVVTDATVNFHVQNR